MITEGPRVVGTKATRRGAQTGQARGEKLLIERAIDRIRLGGEECGRSEEKGGHLYLPDRTASLSIRADYSRPLIPKLGETI